MNESDQSKKKTDRQDKTSKLQKKDDDRGANETDESEIRSLHPSTTTNSESKNRFQLNN